MEPSTTGAASEPAFPDATYLNARTDTYAMLAALLNRPPDPHLLFQIKRVEWNPAMPDGLIDHWIKLRDAARKYPVQAIEKEFQTVFVGLGQGEVVPYASWYLEGLLMTLPLARLRLDLIRLGISRRKEVHEAEDHAGLLCETMALIGSHREIPINVYARFFDEHVASWMFDFFIDLRKAPSAGFYRSVAGLGKCLLELEQLYLSAHYTTHVH
jgi:TorA maturation chaperone TorD